MRIVFYILIALFLLYLGAAFKAPAVIDTSRKLSLAQSPDTVLKKLGDLRFYNRCWNPWSELDTAMKFKYTGNAGQAGHGCEWSGNRNVRSGSLRIVRLSRDSIVEEMKVDDRDAGLTYLVMNRQSDSVIVTWRQVSPVSFFARPFLLFVDAERLQGEMQSRGFEKLKAAMETVTAR